MQSKCNNQSKASIANRAANRFRTLEKHIFKFVSELKYGTNRNVALYYLLYFLHEVQIPTHFYICDTIKPNKTGVEGIHHAFSIVIVQYVPIKSDQGITNRYTN